MVAFIDDATGTRAGAWAACEDSSTAAVDLALPNLLGLQVGEATARLAQLGLVAAVEEQPLPDAPEGVVVAQDPPAGSRMTAGSRVTIKVSAGR
jgi:beta-lactam-binding protein with PASTA domain